MKLETSFGMVAPAGVMLVMLVSSCHTRTPIGEIPDAWQDDDARFGDSDVGPGIGGAVGPPAPGGGSGSPGGSAGGGTVGGKGGAGGGQAMGGATGTATCRSYTNPMGTAGQAGGSCQYLTYPASGFYGANILAGDCTTFTTSVDVELAVMWPSNFSTTVQVALTLLSLSDGPPAPALHPGWYIGADGDWRVSQYDAQTQRQVFETRALLENETIIRFQGTGSARVEIYDCDPNTPTRSKIISWAPAPP